MSGKVLDRLGVNTCIQKIGDVGMPQQVRCHIEVQAIHNVGIVFLMSSQTRLNSVLDALSVHILIISLSLMWVIADECATLGLTVHLSLGR